MNVHSYKKLVLISWAQKIYSPEQSNVYHLLICTKTLRFLMKVLKKICEILGPEAERTTPLMAS